MKTAEELLKLCVELDRGMCPRPETDIQLHRQTATDLIDAALQRAFIDGNERGRHRERRLGSERVAKLEAELKEPASNALRLRIFAEHYDKKGQLTEGNVLRDAADLLEQL